MNWDHVHAHPLLGVLVIASVYSDLLKEDHEYFPEIMAFVYFFKDTLWLNNLRCIFRDTMLGQEIALTLYGRWHRKYVQLRTEWSHVIPVSNEYLNKRIFYYRTTIFHFTFHSKCFSCAGLSVSENRAIETFHYRINQCSSRLFIDIFLFGAKFHKIE